jgi:hypothetical protein
MTPRQVVEEWIRLFNAADADAIAELYREDATNHQVVQEPAVASGNGGCPARNAALASTRLAATPPPRRPLQPIRVPRLNEARSPPSLPEFVT